MKRNLTIDLARCRSWYFEGLGPRGCYWQDS